MQILTKNRDLVAASSLSWQEEIKAAIRDVDTLLSELDLPGRQGGDRKATGNGHRLPAQPPDRAFGTFVPRPFLKRMRKGDINDPLLAQVLPINLEGTPSPLASPDPNSEARFVAAPGLLQKYEHRALIVAARSCAVHCRYCFRREFPYESLPHSEADWQRSLEIVRQDTSLQEIILSGGDPLMLVDTRLAWFVKQLESIAHVRRLRIHTRLPIVIPSRITDALLDCLSATRLNTTMVLHSNHAQELADDVAPGLDRLRQVPRLILLNQSVLLRGVNDSVGALADLSWRLLDLGVVPYYLHQLDRVRGAMHFEVPVGEGLRLVRELETILPGYALPKYVREIPGQPGKTQLTDGRLTGES